MTDVAPPLAELPEPPTAPERSFSFAARYSDVPRYVLELTRALRPLRLEARACAALAEALSNAIVHGALGIPGRGDRDDLTAYISQILDAERDLGASRDITVRLWRGEDRSVTVEVADPGPGFDWREAPARPGRGLGVLREVAAQVSWNESGNRLRVRFDGGPERRTRPAKRRPARVDVSSRESVQQPASASGAAQVGTSLEYREVTALDCPDEETRS